jgi:hypothetical protein
MVLESSITITLMPDRLFWSDKLRLLFAKLCPVQQIVGHNRRDKFATRFAG